MRELQVSRDFWDDDDGQAAVEAEAELRTCLDHLSQQVVSMQVWPLPDRGRWLAPAIGQADKELPLILFAAVGRASALDLNTSGRS